VVVFAVWEPMLPTDWSAPATSVLDRLKDKRVRQFWDPGHLIAVSIKNSSETSHPDCCERKGFLWDLIAAYPAGLQWNGSLPKPILLNGTVVRTAPNLESILFTRREHM
jgi:hypothetical protein